MPRFDKFDKENDDYQKLSDEDYEWIMGHPNYWHRANPLKKENFDAIMKFLNENDPDVMMARELSKMVQDPSSVPQPDMKLL